MTKEELYADYMVRKVCAEAEFEAYEKVMEYTKRMKDSCVRKRKEAEKALAKGGISKDADMRMQRKKTINLSAESAFITCNNAITEILIDRKKAFIAKVDEIK